MSEYYHSVILEKDYCNGCTHCLDRCPTQAIRVKDGKAVIINERCIDCGECLKVCPFHAKGALTDTIEELKKYKYTIALPAISMYGQFELKYNMNKMFNTLHKIGFDFVYDVAKAADIITIHQKEIVKSSSIKPIISTYCPAITRLIQIRYPSLIENISKLESPMEVAARLIRKKIMDKKGLKSEEIGIFYITQCPAKITSIKKPLGLDKSFIDGAISIENIYSSMIKEYKNVTKDSIQNVQKGTGKSIGWGMVGGQSHAMELENYMAVDGIEEVIKVLDKIELGKLENVDFFEGYACVTGCVGGPLNVENPFIAKNRIRKRSKKCSEKLEKMEKVDREFVEWDKAIHSKSVLKLDTDMKVALQKMSQIEEITQLLPGINCGACGAPTCRALAEDIIRDNASIEDCVVRNEQVRKKGESKDEG